MTSDQDITLQASGGQYVNLIKKGLDDISPQSLVTLLSLDYGPPRSPAPPWTNFKQYTCYLPKLCPNYGTPVSGGAVGCLIVLARSDMSNQTVLPEKTYTFIIKAYHWTHIFVQYVGGPFGTTVVPGFGIYGLPENPKGYTYISPEPDWQGDWSIAIRSSLSANLLQMAVEYAPPKDLGGGGLMSAMTFTLQGALGRYDWSDGAADPDSPDGADGGPAFLRPGGSPYRIVDLSGRDGGP